MEEDINMNFSQQQLSKEKIIELLKDSLKEKEVKSLNPLILAYIGDAIYEVSVRKYLIQSKKKSVNQLHKTAIQFVKAKSQSCIIHYMMDNLTPEEQMIVKRGRNSKSQTVPKHANISDYRYATGFEALIGYLYLIGEEKRLVNILAKSIEFIQNELDENPS
ncbi:Mini-ribonuclease 3 [Garciella nitratireducens]|uniref:Mini-ribonuclease 3 n=1 Tax=Garciella nitratireducens DSM 15102 TaxID=1121911 RepID=A0A1T4PKF4_9FIRM|nr:ribonuclease III domain-containing protein [Garciella nitratireducens]SJZ92043.1 ribonuclease-3 family protein [Garciella nitratireducens DSM 15102]